MVNSIAVRGRDQVMLKVTVAEVQRSIIKQLGIDLSANMNYGTTVVSSTTSHRSPQTVGARPGNALHVVRLDAIGPGDAARDGIRRCRADARRTQSDSDLRRVRDIHLRRRISIPTGVTCKRRQGRYRKLRPDGQLQEVRYLAQLHAGGADRGRISLGDDRSVGSLDRKRFDWRCRWNDDSFDQDPPRGNHAGNSIGRRHDDGRADQDQTKQAINGLPGLAQLPILGTLFRSRDFVNNQTELMVLVTPYIVRAVAQKDLSRPDDGFAAASDPQADLLGSINRIYGVPGRVEPARNYRGTYGFITD